MGCGVFHMVPRSAHTFPREIEYLLLAFSYRANILIDKWWASFVSLATMTSTNIEASTSMRNKQTRLELTESWIWSQLIVLRNKSFIETNSISRRISIGTASHSSPQLAAFVICFVLCCVDVDTIRGRLIVFEGFCITSVFAHWKRNANLFGW